MNTTKPTMNQVAALVGNWVLNTTSITTITNSSVGSSFSARSCLPFHWQVPDCSSVSYTHLRAHETS